MAPIAQHMRGFWWVGLACATGAVGLGLVYLAVAGASTRQIGMNGAAYLVGLAAYATIVGPRWRNERLSAWLLPGLGLALLATALAGAAVEGASRWATVGPMTLQVSLIVLPAMVVLFARAPAASGAVGLVIAALALAMQPDRAMAGALAVSLAMLSLHRRDRQIVIALAAALAGFVAALAQPDTLPASPFVDQIFYTSFDIHPLAGLSVLLGAGLLLAPALMRVRGSAADVALVFGAVWLAILIAAAVGNYPTPLVGYGGSAIVGYLLSLAVLTRAHAAMAAPHRGAALTADRNDGRSLSASLA